MKKNKKEKKYIAPNECSGRRWLGVLAMSGLFSMLLSFPVALLMMDRTGTFLGVNYEIIMQLMNFVPLFFGMVIALKVVGKTSLKEFVLGAGKSFNMKENLTILAVFAAGFALGNLTDFNNTHLRGVTAGEFGGLVLVMLALAWMQTTCEELFFRGVFLRWFCKNDIGFNKKSILATVFSTVLFALFHIANPEVTSLSGVERIVIMFAYVIPGLVFFLADLYFGNMMPGIIMHWVNNFLLFTLISGEVSAVAAPTLLVSTASHNAYGVLISTVVTYLPMAVYILWDAMKKKKAAAV